MPDSPSILPLTTAIEFARQPTPVAAGVFESLGRLADVFVQIIVAPWRAHDVLWGIIPVYAALLIGILYSAGRKVTWGSTVASGFALLWVSLNWGRHTFTAIYREPAQIQIVGFSLAFLVTVACVGLGLTSIILGLRRKAQRTCQVLGHFTFNTYVFITFYPMQSHIQGMEWTVERLLAIVLFAVPFWVFVRLIGVARRRKKRKPRPRRSQA